MSIDINTVRKVAKLARIRTTDAHAEVLTGELNNILAMIEQLNEVKTDGVEPMTSVVAQRLKMRDDEVTAGGDAGAVTAHAPESEDHYFVVPTVVE